MNKLEAFQPHLSHLIKLSQVLENLSHKNFNEVLKDLEFKTNKSFGDSFLYSKQEEIFQRLDILDRVNSRI